MELQNQRQVCAGATAVVLLLLLYTSWYSPVAAGDAASGSADHSETITGETLSEQPSEGTTETAVFEKEGRRQGHRPKRTPHGSFYFSKLGSREPAEGATAPISQRATLTTLPSTIVAQAPTQATVRTCTKVLEEGDETEPTTSIDVHHAPNKTHQTPQTATGEKQTQQLLTKREHNKDKTAASTKDEESHVERTSEHRRSRRRRPRQAATVGQKAAAGESNAPHWSDYFEIQRQQDQELEEERAGIMATGFPMRSAQQESLEYQEWIPHIDNLSNMMSDPDDETLMGDASTEETRRMKEVGYDIAPFAVEEDEGDTMLLSPQQTKMDVLFRHTDLLGLRLTATGSVVCTKGGVYGFATPARPGPQQFGEAFSPPRVHLQRHSADVIVLIGDAGSAAAAENTTLEIPFAPSVSESAAAEALQEDSKVVLLCTAPGQPVVALPAKHVNILQESVLKKKEEDLQIRVEYVRDAAASRETERFLRLTRRLSRTLVYISVGVLIWSMLSFASKCTLYSEKKSQLLTNLLVKDPSSLNRFLKEEEALQSFVLDMGLPENCIDVLEDCPNSTLNELRNMRKSVKSITGKIKLFAFVAMAHLFIRSLHTGSTSLRKHMDRRRTLVLQGVPLDQVDAVFERREKAEQQSTGKEHVPAPQAVAEEESPDEQQEHGSFRKGTPAGADRQASAFALVDKAVSYVSGTSAEGAALEEEDQSFVKALRNVEKHWNAAPFLTPEQLEEYNLVMVVPDDVTSPDEQKPTRLLIVYSGQQEQEPEGASEEQYMLEQSETSPRSHPDADAEEQELEYLLEDGD